MEEHLCTFHFSPCSHFLYLFPIPVAVCCSNIHFRGILKFHFTCSLKHIKQIYKSLTLFSSFHELLRKFRLMVVTVVWHEGCITVLWSHYTQCMCRVVCRTVSTGQDVYLYPSNIVDDNGNLKIIYSPNSVQSAGHNRHYFMSFSILSLIVFTRHPPALYALRNISATYFLYTITHRKIYFSK